MAVTSYRDERLDFDFFADCFLVRSTIFPFSHTYTGVPVCSPSSRARFAERRNERNVASISGVCFTRRGLIDYLPLKSTAVWCPYYRTTPTDPPSARRCLESCVTLRQIDAGRQCYSHCDHLAQLSLLLERQPFPELEDPKI